MNFVTRSKEASRSLWTVPWQQPAEKRQAEDHFGSESLWIPRAGRPERERKRGEEGNKGEVKRGNSRSRANLNGGELDGENTSSTHKGIHKGGSAGRRTLKITCVRQK